MFEKFQMAPPDAILGLTEAFKKDPNPKKINLGVGVYKDALGTTPVMESVKKAEEIILKNQTTKSYLPIPGSAEYAAVVQEFLFGSDHEIIGDKRAVTAQTPGGTGALRVAGDLLKQVRPDAAMWVSDPTWANHTGIFTNAGFEVKKYPYYDAAAKAIDLDAMKKTLKTIPEGDVVLLHGCCHNPTGIDPDIDQWGQICDILVERKILPFVDFAYQGLANGIEEDAQGLRLIANSVKELVAASSFSKNFGLYNERIGAITFVCDSSATADKLASNLKLIIRRNYSNPPAHGAAIVATIMNNTELKKLWQSEVKQIRDRIKEMRHSFVDTLKSLGVKNDFSFITEQNGMFSFSGLNKDQVDTLREKYSIYIVGSGRINVAGMTAGNMNTLCKAIAEVLK
ncbi:MAG: aspartate/tyrosine/aromatic aminotransferase [Sedimentisphaerales bacterium]|nr:aspartate/tyrosine/aromatic aminotransferase [Sedimentisphaerales bacterium]